MAPMTGGRETRLAQWAAVIWLLGVCPLGASGPGSPIALDVGHSLARPGAVSARGRTEFDFNRELALVVRQVLQARGLQTQLIGIAGDMNDLRARTVAALGARFFLSLHHDAVQPQYLEHWEVNGHRRAYSDRFSGFSLFVSRANPRPTVSLACASAMGAALRQAGFTPTPHHAEPIAGENRPFADAQNGVHYFDELVVLKTASMPAVLLEAGIILNREEELRLQQASTQELLASAIADGLQACLDGSAEGAP